MLEGENVRLEGRVEHLIYDNPQNGYAVFELSSGDELIVAAGNVGEVHVGENVVLRGCFSQHPTYGDQFKATSCEATLPQDKEGTLAYLASGALPYIGPATAQKIVAAFGPETLDVVAQQPERLAKIKGLSLEKAKAIAREFARMFGVREVIVWMRRFGLSAQQAVEVFREMGPHTLEVLTQNPYLLCGEPLHLRFAQADAIAAELQLAQDGELRIRAALLYTLRHNAQSGHTCVPCDRLVATAGRFIGVADAEVSRCLDSTVEEGELCRRELDGTDFIFLPDLWQAERDVAETLRQLAHYPPEKETGLARNIDYLEKAQGFCYAELQRTAIEMALTHHVFVLTGGPGTGKTTTLNAILALFESEYKRVALCAPTGRAAKRMSELTGHKASTIHRLLEVDFTAGRGDTVRFIHNEKNLLKCDVLILDEMSMVDVRLFQSLLAALRPSCRLVLVGDADQLPSVGPGNVLGEIVRSGLLPTVCLTEIFRQAAQSLIVANAHRIVQGQMPQKGGREDDFFMLEAGGLACQKLVCDLVCERLPKTYRLDPMQEIQVLCPTKLGPAGTGELNKCLQQRLNPPARDKNELEAYGKLFREGDKVMQVRNNYDIVYEREGGEAGVGAFNGDMGIITEVNPAQRTLRVRMEDRLLTYAGDSLAELEMAYAVTVHKSQGSEFPAVVLPVAEVPPRLCYRNLLYTGVTRAKQLCILAGRAQTVRTMVENVRQNLRYSGLHALLQEGDEV